MIPMLVRYLCNVGAAGDVGGVDGDGGAAGRLDNQTADAEPECACAARHPSAIPALHEHLLDISTLPVEPGAFTRNT
jgi:hypothetical protein